MPLGTEIIRAPALRISHIVCGRVNEDGRVRYFIDPEGQSRERAIPEDVVLRRWRSRVMVGQSFHGARMGPNLWRAVSVALGSDAQAICQMSADEISRARENLHQDQPIHKLWLPDTSILLDMFAFLGPERLQIILARHLDPSRMGRFGTPDLFLFTRATTRSKAPFFRMVEVKKPQESVSIDQMEEMTFLRSLGIPARLLRLIER